MFSKSANITYLFLSSLIASITVPLESLATYSEALEVYEKAIASSALVKKIHEDGVDRRQEEARQLKIVLNSIVENQNKDHEKLHQSVIHSLEQDKITFDALNQELKEKGYQPGMRGATYQLLYNRMPIITEDTLKLAKEGDLFFEILDGKLPKGYAIDPPVFNYFPESEHIYSHGRRGNAFKSLLLKIWLIQNDKRQLSQVRQLFEHSWLETAPFVHLTPLPNDLDVSAFQLCPHYFSDSRTPKGLLTIHNGYAFGGHRDEPRYLEGKKWGPHDCSSFVSLYIKCKRVFSTSHQAQYFQEVNGLQFNHLDRSIVKRWEELKPQRQADTYLQSLREVLLPLSPNPNPQTLKAGFVHAERSYKESTLKPEDALFGTVGHTGIFLGAIGSAAETKALTITAARDLEDTGKEFIYGIEPRPLLSEPERMIMLFNVKNKW